MDRSRLTRIAEIVAGPKTPKLTPEMKETLQWVKSVLDPANQGKAKVTLSRPSHPANIRVHDALVKGGFLTEGPNGETDITELGKNSV